MFYRYFLAINLNLKARNLSADTSSCNKRPKPQAPTPQVPIPNGQTRKVANAKVLNRYTNLYDDRPTYPLAVTNFGVCGVGACGFWRYRMHPS